MLKSSPQVPRLRWRMCSLFTVLLCLCPLVVSRNKYLFIIYFNCYTWLFFIVFLHHHLFLPLLTEISCNFEVNLCGWYQDQTDNYDWRLRSGMDHTVHDGQDAFDAAWIIHCFFMFENISIIIQTCFFSLLFLSQVGVWWWICGTLHCEVSLDVSSQSDSIVTQSTVCPSSTNSMGQTQVDLNTLFPAS